MSFLGWLGWLVSGTAAGYLAWILARLFTAKSVNPGVSNDTWVFISLLLFGLGLGIFLSCITVSVPVGIGVLVVSVVLTAISLVDFWSRRIPDILNLALLAWALMQITWQKQPTFASSGLGLLISGGLFFILALVGRGAMGLGDVKLAAALGALLGFPLVLIAVFIGVISGGLAAIGLVIAGRGKRGSTMAYGPYLALGGWVAIIGAAIGLWVH